MSSNNYSKDPTPEEQGARSRNAVTSGARDVPLLLTATHYVEGEQTASIIGKFYVSKVQLEKGLKFIAEGHDVEQRQARRRLIFSNLIAMSRK